MTAHLVSVAFGAGVNSTALLVGCHERGLRPDWILFADTGGELPETYAHVARMSDWCVERSLPPITTVSAAGRDASLEAECLRKGQLPSIVFGMHGCARDWKVKPQASFLLAQPEVRQAIADGYPIERWIGIAAEESHRARPEPEPHRWKNRWPLLEWAWDRDDCIAAIERAGLGPVPKSACFFCPARKKQEVLALPPDLLDRAIAMEDSARAAGTLKVVKGLGRHWSWRRLREADQRQMRLFAEPPAIACVCEEGTA